MSKCGICGADTFWTGAKLWEAHSWLCRSCLQKAGGYSSAPLFGTLDDIKKAIEKMKLSKSIYFQPPCLLQPPKKSMDSWK